MTSNELELAKMRIRETAAKDAHNKFEMSMLGKAINEAVGETKIETYDKEELTTAYLNEFSRCKEIYSKET